MGEYVVEFTPKHRPEPIHEATGFAEWYDRTDPENRLEEAVNLGFIEIQRGDDEYFLETVLDEARRLNHGPAWIKEIMDSEREADNPYLAISEEAEEKEADLDEVIEAYKLHIAIRDYGVGRNNDASISKETIKSLEEAVSGLF